MVRDAQSGPRAEGKGVEMWQRRKWSWMTWGMSHHLREEVDCTVREKGNVRSRRS